MKLIVRIAIGSLNPVKQRAAESVLAPLYPGVMFKALATASGVSVQPWGDVETRTGAINRARAAQIAADADLGIGFEGGVAESEVGLLICNWTAVIARDGRIGIGGGGGEQLPEQVAAVLRAGHKQSAEMSIERVELGTAMDALTGLTNVKQSEGAVGILTGGLLNRQMVFEMSLKLALAPFLTPQWYNNSPQMANGAAHSIHEHALLGDLQGDL
jgi:inosine/xanthosine triphosphatase